ncbi:sensor histidine kinase [Hungatella effluvii]|uniref:sensor histidine kinase n=1 Tax=Hungatella effluvii TaxID=1096246 RepID=UPI0022E3B100|nr:HAMP domain-containing sensor histidine kinase [Hungatella effluvii]
MIKELRKKLTLLYTVTTGTILTLVVAGLLFYNLRVSEKDALQTFQNQIVAVASRMQYGSTISRSWLAQTEASEKLIIHIEENREPFLYPGSWVPATDRQTLIDRAREEALKEKVNPAVRPVSSSVIQSSVFTVKGEQGDSYYGTILVFPTAKGYQSLTLLGYRTPGASLIRSQGPRFLLFDILGIFALFLVSWYFVGKSLEPVELSRKRQNEFIASASHELRSPLAVIESSVTAIDAVAAAPPPLQSAECSEKQAQYLKNIRSECRRMAALVGDMLLLASSDAGSWSIKQETVDMDTLLIETYELFEPVCQSSQIRLFLDLPEETLPHVNGDASCLKQLLTILLDNAVSYTPANKKITISAAVNGKEITVSVADQGCGIPADVRAHIFDRFYRGDTSRTDKRHFGLGLSIAKELTTLHGGRILVDETEGGGATFRVKLPVVGENEGKRL